MQDPNHKVQEKLSRAILVVSEIKKQEQKEKQPGKSKPKGLDSDIFLGEPNMSDTGLLVTVEDLINLAFGPHDINKINFKLVRMIINMLANQLRLLDKKVQLNTEMMMKRDAAAEKASDRVIVSHKKLEKRGKDEATHKSASVSGKSEIGEISDEFDDFEEDFNKSGLKPESKKSVADSKREYVLEKQKSVADTKKEMSRMESKKSFGDPRKDISRIGLDTKKSILDITRKDVSRMGLVVKRSVGDAMKEALESKMSVSDAKKDIHSLKRLRKDKKEAREMAQAAAECLRRTESAVRDIGGIEVVPMSRFKQLEDIIEGLKDKIIAPRIPVLPDNQKLRDDLKRGTASLSDTMNALGLAARVQAAENAIERLSVMVTKLASETAFQVEPGKMAKSSPQEKLDEKIVKETRKYHEEGREKEVVVYVKEHEVPKEAQTSTHKPLHPIKSGVKSAHSMYSMHSLKSSKVTYEEMIEKMRELSDSLLKKLSEATGFATTAAEKALVTVTALSHKLEVALGLDNRITLITSIVHDYVQEMRGLDQSKDAQMSNIQNQLNLMASELHVLVELLEKYDKNAQNTAITELNEFYQLLVQELEDTVERHQKAVNNQDQINVEIKSLVECIEALRAQKADRDEVRDGLKDKADVSRLRGLLKEKIFVVGQMNLESRLLACNEKFRQQEETWMLVIKDFTELTKLKADIQHVFEAKEAMQEGLQDIYKKLQLLARVLGDPKAAVVTRKMELSASCGACKTPARLDTRSTEELAMKLPFLGKHHLGKMQADRDQEAMWELLDVPIDRKHVCHRWAGGSHTTMPISVFTKQEPYRFPSATPMKSYFTLGNDGKTYKCSKIVGPCLCNDPVGEAK